MGSSGVAELHQAAELIDAVACALDVSEVPVTMADRLMGMLARCERQVGALRLALARRVTETGLHEGAGARDGVGYLARATGTARGRARGELALAERVGRSPVLAQALREGRISSDQARVIVPAVEADPSCAPDLVAAAQQESFAELRRRAGRTERAGRGEDRQENKERRAHERRYCRTSTSPEGGVRVDALLGVAEGARFLSALDKRTGELLHGADEPFDRLRADALVELCCGHDVRTEVQVRVDAAALVRGGVQGDETCEVQGLGPISVRAARALLGEAFVTLLVTKGTDVSTVTSTTRFVPTAVRKALELRDPTCVVPGCGSRHHLEIDHWRIDFEKTGPTSLDNLCRLCSVHHRQKTNGILVLGGGPGRWFTRPGRMAGRRAGEPMRFGGPLRAGRSDRTARATVGHAASTRRTVRSGP